MNTPVLEQPPQTVAPQPLLTRLKEWLSDLEAIQLSTAHFRAEAKDDEERSGWDEHYQDQQGRIDTLRDAIKAGENLQQRILLDFEDRQEIGDLIPPQESLRQIDGVILW